MRVAAAADLELDVVCGDSEVLRGESAGAGVIFVPQRQHLTITRPAAHEVSRCGPGRIGKGRCAPVLKGGAVDWSLRRVDTVLIRGEGLAVERAHNILCAGALRECYTAGVKSEHQHPFGVALTAIDLQLEQAWALPLAAHGVDWAEFADVLPDLQV